MLSAVTCNCYLTHCARTSAPRQRRSRASSSKLHPQLTWPSNLTSWRRFGIGASSRTTSSPRRKPSCWRDKGAARGRPAAPRPGPRKRPRSARHARLARDTARGWACPWRTCSGSGSRSGRFGRRRGSGACRSRTVAGERVVIPRVVVPGAPEVASAYFCRTCQRSASSDPSSTTVSQSRCSVLSRSPMTSCRTRFGLTPSRMAAAAVTRPGCGWRGGSCCARRGATTAGQDGQVRGLRSLRWPAVPGGGLNAAQAPARPAPHGRHRVRVEAVSDSPARCSQRPASRRSGRRPAERCPGPPRGSCAPFCQRPALAPPANSASLSPRWYGRCLPRKPYTRRTLLA